MSSSRLNRGTDQEILRHVGQRLRALREARGLTATDAAERAGIARKTLYSAEQGSNPTLLTLVRLLRLYGGLDSLEHFAPEPEISPMQLLEERRRGGSRRGDRAT